MVGISRLSAVVTQRDETAQRLMILRAGWDGRAHLGTTGTRTVPHMSMFCTHVERP